MTIEILVKDDNGETVAKRESLSFESAQEDLGKLENYTRRESLRILSEIENRDEE